MITNFIAINILFILTFCFSIYTISKIIRLYSLQPLYNKLDIELYDLDSICIRNNILYITIRGNSSYNIENEVLKILNRNKKLMRHYQIQAFVINSTQSHKSVRRDFNVSKRILGVDVN